MRPVQERWARERLVAVGYDVAVQTPLLATVGARLLWGFDVREMFAEIDRAADLPAGTRVLDVPTGGGLVPRALPPGHGLDVVAVDLSPVMVERARALAERRGVEGVRFAVADATAMPFPDADFDVVLSYTGLHCFADPEAALREFRRVLRPGGELRLTTVVRGAGRRQDDAVRMMRGLGVFGHVGTADEVRGWLGAAGFAAVEGRRMGALAVFSAR
ncbi:class I SAM-dependent methyltransferase [Patulibacter sp. SYSU D01012]|uniref:class I SAM-dependent methyltransferase n=1 Tax=Patulibacter sp. SYSU D01012 TaxID=2817381 RepID=UPI001B310A7C|nr:class I SAM-dependent methyltransferase [Patulibacter sp. SYSU D01012]